MKRIMNITTGAEDLPRFRDNEDLVKFYRRHGLDGLEVLQAGADEKGIIRPDNVLGVHLCFFPAWMDMWMGNKERLMEEYGSLPVAEAVYGGWGREAIIRAYQGNLEFARTLNPEYLALHVSECTLKEAVSRHYHYSDEQVVDAVSELVKEIFRGMDWRPLLLFENLWYSGLTMLRPEITERLLEGADYPHKGVMLDMGHLLHTNPKLGTIEEGIGYIRQALSPYPDLSFIRGVHLHQTLNGKLALEWMGKETSRSTDYQERLRETLAYIYQIDSHQPLLSPQLPALIEQVDPEYLVYELISRNRKEHDKLLEKQRKSFH